MITVKRIIKMTYTKSGWKYVRREDIAVSVGGGPLVNPTRVLCAIPTQAPKAEGGIA